MHPEIEAKFLNVDHDALRRKLKNLGAVLEKPLVTMRRTVFDYPDGRFEKNRSRLRVRDEGDKVTVTFKRVRPDQYSDEIETTAGSYDTMVEIFIAMGFQSISKQESKRETWRYRDAQITLDEWPWIKPYIEIEGSSEKQIKAIAEELGFNWEQAVFGSAEPAYRAEFPGIAADEGLADIPEDILFDKPLPAWLEERRTAA